MRPFIRPGGYSSPFLLHIHDTALLYCEALGKEHRTVAGEEQASSKSTKTARLGSTDHN